MRHAAVDVVVVGAGLAGLTAATVLHDAGLTVRVLEARDRVGGRTHTEVHADTAIDLGGQWLGPTQTRVVALADELGLERFESGVEFPNDRSGMFSFELDGVISRLPNLDLLPVAEIATQQFSAAMTELERLVATVDTAAPWLTPDAELWDSMTVTSWMHEKLPDPQARALFQSATLMDLAAHPSEMSMLGLMFDGATWDGAPDVERWRLTGGTQQLSEGLAARLPADSLRLSSPARRISWAERSATVWTDDFAIECRRVVVALPPQLAGRLDYEPAMPAQRDGFTSRVPSTSVIKCHAVYDANFWSPKGLNGWALLPNDDVLDVIGDNSPAESSTSATNAAGANKAVLVGFIQSRNATRLGALSADDRRELVLGTFARLFGPEALQPISYVEANWAAEPYSRGCFQCVPSTNTWVHFGPAWREAVGPIHWAASEYSHVWYGYMEGAMASGEAVAAAIISSHL